MRLFNTIAIVVISFGAAVVTADAGSPDYPGAIEQGTSKAFTPDANGVPYIMPWVSDRTARQNLTPNRIYREKR